MSEEGTWVDVAPLHESDAARRVREARKRFEHGVGLDGYERGTGEEVVREPTFKRPGEKAMAKQPFEE